MKEYYDCGNGWVSLIEEAKKIVSDYNLEHPELEFPLHFTQIKEKWGGLCLYLNEYIYEVQDKIKELEHKSFGICEHCGTNENVKTEWTHGWVMTLCDECRKKEIERYENCLHN